MAVRKGVCVEMSNNSCYTFSTHPTIKTILSRLHNYLALFFDEYTHVPLVEKFGGVAKLSRRKRTPHSDKQISLHCCAASVAFCLV